MGCLAVALGASDWGLNAGGAAAETESLDKSSLGERELRCISSFRMCDHMSSFCCKEVRRFEMR